MNEMCIFCGEKSRFLYPFDPKGEIHVCETCDCLYGPGAREIAFKIKENISNNIVKFLDENYFYVKPEIKEWIKKYH